jgi:SAM-dependent methyltransferase
VLPLTENTPVTHDTPDYIRLNRDEWDAKAAEYAATAPRAWAQTEPSWGQLNIPEATIGALPRSLAGLDVVDLGCGTGYFCAWLARKGAKPVGVDASPCQLATARRMQEEFGIEFPLHLGNAETLPFADGSFDLAISEYGASIWCDPYKWIPEAARVLRPAGRLVFLVNGLLVMLCSSLTDSETTPVGTSLKQPAFGMHRFAWENEPSVEFHLNHGDMIRVLRQSGFEVEQLIELQAPEDIGQADPLIPYVPNAWARQWPAEEIWCVRKRER